ncbi:MAG: hypothetical protein HQL53_00075 [Magnetococcales bacterium]|nr:hypothetical protein [Magnetococcales bacterium]
MQRTIRWLVMFAVTVLFMGGTLPMSEPLDDQLGLRAGLADAKSKRYKSSKRSSRGSWGRSSRSSSSRSKATSSRNRYAKPSSMGYGKPSQTTKSTSSYGKPSSSGYGKPSSSSAGYGKPSSSGYGKPKAATPSTSTRQSGGYGKPTSKVATGTSSSGYGKPGAGAVASTGPPQRPSHVNQRKASSYEQAMSRNRAASAMKEREEKIRAQKAAKARAAYKGVPGVKSSRPGPWDQASRKQARYDQRSQRSPSGYPYRSGYRHHKKMDLLPDLDDVLEGLIVARLAGAMGGAAIGGASTAAARQHDLDTLEPQQKNQVSAWLAALAPDPSGKKSAPVRFGGGTRGGLYQLFCEGDKKWVAGLKQVSHQRMAIKCDTTGGSKANIKGFLKQRYQAVLAQADLIDATLRKESKANFGPHQLTVYQEPFWLLVNDKSGIKGAEDLDPDKHTLYIGPKGSGVKSSWSNLAHHAAQPAFLGFGGEAKYGQIKTARLPYLKAAQKVARDKNAVMLMVVGLSAPILQEINDRFGDRIKLAPFDDDRFVNAEDREGQPIYDACQIPGGRYDKLQRGWFDSSVETLCVDAVMVVSDKWIKSEGPAAEKAMIAAAGVTASQLKARISKSSHQSR